MSNRSKFLQNENNEIEVILCPVPEEHHVFNKRFNSVQSMIVRMIAIGRKKGRPSLKDCEYEDAA